MIQKRNQFKNYLPLIVLVVTFIIVFFVGLIVGKKIDGQRAETVEVVKYIEETPDREYIERFNIAGTEEYQYILIREYELDAEFVVSADWARGRAK